MNQNRIVSALLNQLNTVILGKTDQTQDCLTCLLAGGHLLIEDVPGVGKTTLAHALAISLGLSYTRVQFTADLMPADLLGVSVYARTAERFTFHPGPVFTQVLLADEINRASPRTQSALLEAMAERQVSVDGATRALPAPFFVIATQNPAEQHGVFPLPESQLDRFMMRVTLGYPAAADERRLLAGEDRRALVHALPALTQADDLLRIQAEVTHVHAADALLDYVQALVAATRSGRWFAHGLSPRGALALLQAARANAYVEGRDYVAPDDVRRVFSPTVAHRLVPSGVAASSTAAAATLIDAIALP